MGTTASSRSGYDVGLAIGVEVTGCHLNPAAKRGMIGKDIPDWLAVASAEHADVWATTGTRPGYNVDCPIAIDVPYSYLNTTAKLWIVCEELA